MTETATADNSLASRPPRGKRSAELAPSQPLPTVIKQVIAPQPAAPAVMPVVDVSDWLPAGFERKPFGGHVQKLAYPERPGFHRHWFNDYPGRIARALEAGYKHVIDREGKNVARIVGTAEKGGGLNAFLMEIPMQYYLEDQRVKDRGRDELDAKMKRGVIAGVTPGQDGSYLPTNQAGTIGPDIKINGR